MKTVQGDRQAIHTSTWFTNLPPNHQRVGISLYKPRGFKREHWEIKALAPGGWYKLATPKEYLQRYRAILDSLNPQDVVNALFAIGPNPVMCCYKKPVDINAGTEFCHRHMVAKWLGDTLGLDVKEIDATESFDPWRAFRRLQIPIPDYRLVNILAGG